MPKLTKRLIDSLTATEKEEVFWDDELKGFGVRLKTSGRKTFIIQYRNRLGRSKRMTIGQYGRLTPEEARKQARQHLAQVDAGNDPSGERDAARKAPTLKQVAERYLEEHAKLKKKPKSAAEDERLLEQFILPRLGGHKASAITRQDITKLHHDMRETPIQANRILALLSKMFNLMEPWGVRPDNSNPCRHVQKNRENERERYLSEEELKRLGKVLAEVEAENSELPSVVPALRFLILTGCRISEALTLKWEHVDMARGFLHLQDTKTGNKLLPLSDAAKDVIASTPRIVGNPYVFPGNKGRGHLVNLQKPWVRIKQRAELDNLRIHDLRHSFASFGAGSGLGLPIIGALLGHSQPATTARYAHLATDPLREATNRIGAQILENMK